MKIHTSPLCLSYQNKAIYLTEQGPELSHSLPSSGPSNDVFGVVGSLELRLGEETRNNNYFNFNLFLFNFNFKTRFISFCHCKTSTRWDNSTTQSKIF